MANLLTAAEAALRTWRSPLLTERTSASLEALPPIRPPPSRASLWPRMNPCPACKSRAVLTRRTVAPPFSRHTPRCLACNYRLGWFPSQDDAIRAWNRNRGPQFKRRAGRA